MSGPYMALEATTLGRRIAGARKAQKLSQQALADAAGITRNQLSRWETGSTWPPLPELAKVRHVLGITWSELLD